MAEYIEREEVIDKLTMLFPLLKKRTIKNILKAVPTADVQPVVRGEWELVDGAEPRRYGCSVCKRLSWDETNFCPNCGARMVEDAK